MKRQVLQAILLILPIHIVLSQSIEKMYDLSFEDIQGEHIRWSWVVGAQGIVFTVDSITVDSKYPLKISSHRGGHFNEANFTLTRTIPLPERVCNEICEVVLRCKNENMETLKFSATYIDENENILFSDSILIGKFLWENHRISFANERIKAVRISISLEDESLWKPKYAWIDGISIYIGGKTINDETIENLYSKKNSELKKKYIIPLSNHNNIQKIFNRERICKIIGLGESTHGSQEIKKINYQFMKTLITDFNYKIILTERAIDQTLMCDLYIRGLISESFENQIKEDAKCYFDDYLSFFDFLNWAREYNKTAKNQIRIFGIDSFIEKQACLFEYFQFIIDEKNHNLPNYLEKIFEGKFQEVKNMAMNDISLQSTLSQADFNFLIFLLEQDDMDVEKRITAKNYSYNRDEDMWLVMEKVIDIYAPGNEKVMVYSHSDHVNKYNSFLSGQLSLGNYISSKYKEDYFVISYQVAEGMYTQDEATSFGKTTIHELQQMPKNSFEYRGLDMGLGCFYYPTNQLSQDVTQLRILFQTGRYLDQFYFCSIKKRFDGLVFIRNSSNLHNIEKYPFFKAGEVAGNKRMRMRQKLNKY